MAQSSNSLLCQIAMKLGKDGGHAIKSNNQWLSAIAGSRSPLSSTQLYQVIANRHDGASVVSCLSTIVGHNVSSEQDGIEAWALKEGVLPPQGLAPGVLVAPVVTGTLTQGETLTVSQGTWSQSPTGYTYQWIRTDSSGANPIAIGGATSTTYVLTSDDAGNKVRAKVTASNAFGSRDYYTPISAVVEAQGALSVTNAQKLGLDPSSPTDGTTIVAVSDGFTFDGDFYAPTADSNGKHAYVNPNNSSETAAWDAFAWRIPSYYSTDDVAEPWLATNWLLSADDTPASLTLTHPAIQVLVPPSTVQGGVAVIGGTIDGVYTNRGSFISKDGFKRLGQTYDPFDDFVNAIVFGRSSDRENAWEIYGDDPDHAIYYSLSDTLTPDLAPGWLNAADDTPATITVTSVSVGELYAGLFVANDGATNGSSYVSQPFAGRQYYMGLNGGGSNNMHWDTDFNVWTDDVGAWTTSNVCFPWQGTDNGGGHTGATFSRNNVANERNWEVV